MKNKALFRFTTLILALIMSVSLFACNGEEDPPKDDDDDYVFDPYPYEDLSVFMDLPQYKGLSVPRSTVDTMMENTLASFYDTYDLYDKNYEGTVKDGDIVNINYIGTIDGEQFDGGTALDRTIQIGSNTLIDGFEDGIIGMQVAQTKNLYLKFPENYYKEFAGKDVVFAVTVNYIHSEPELTDEICRQYTDYQSKDEFLVAVKNNCIYNYIWNKLLTDAKLKSSIPQQEYSDYYQYFKGTFNSFAQDAGLTLQGFLNMYGDYYSDAGIYSGMTTEEFELVAQDYAESQVTNDLLLYSIMRAENIQISGKEWESAKAQLKLETGYTYQELVEKYDGQTTAIITVLTIRVKNIITANTQITEK